MYECVQLVESALGTKKDGGGDNWLELGRINALRLPFDPMHVDIGGRDGIGHRKRLLALAPTQIPSERASE